jgi:hypothetical protein
VDRPADLYALQQPVPLPQSDGASSWSFLLLVG